MNGTRGLVIAIAAAFVVGCSVGLMGGILFMRFAAPGPPMAGLHGPRPPYFGPAGPGARGGPEQMLPRLERALQLSAEQHDRIVAILDGARHGHAAMRESMHVEIERVLTPEQRERWRKLEERFERPRRGRWSREPMPPDRP